MEYKKAAFGDGQLFPVRSKIVMQSDLSSDCWTIQIWGLTRCRECEYLATEECGGYRIRRKILSGRYPKHGLPDIRLRRSE
jgi:hypothetical protein